MSLHFLGCYVVSSLLICPAFLTLPPEINFIYYLILPHPSPLRSVENGVGLSVLLLVVQPSVSQA